MNLTLFAFSLQRRYPSSTSRPSPSRHFPVQSESSHANKTKQRPQGIDRLQGTRKTTAAILAHFSEILVDYRRLLDARTERRGQRLPAVVGVSPINGGGGGKSHRVSKVVRIPGTPQNFTVCWLAWVDDGTEGTDKWIRVPIVTGARAWERDGEANGDAGTGIVAVRVERTGVAAGLGKARSKVAVTAATFKAGSTSAQTSPWVSLQLLAQYPVASSQWLKAFWDPSPKRMTCFVDSSLGKISVCLHQPECNLRIGVGAGVTTSRHNIELTSRVLVVLDSVDIRARMIRHLARRAEACFFVPPTSPFATFCIIKKKPLKCPQVEFIQCPPFKNTSSPRSSPRSNSVNGEDFDRPWAIGALHQQEILGVRDDVVPTYRDIELH
ncbi:hypothetical protein C8R43DRAFT_942279 [Mycena crocata]|nr:hypothetical protein C8R43DRAFT_942279 [Mycena crocata]